MAISDHYSESEFPASKNNVFDAFSLAIPTLKGMKVESADTLQGRILVNTGISLHSWGEKITIQLIEIDENKTKVEITSSPKRDISNRYQSDWGKNRKNIESILSATSKILQQQIQQPISNYKSSQTQGSQNYLNTPQHSASTKWYNNKAIVILLCILFFPVGIYGLWKNSKIKIGWKIAGTILILFYVIGLVANQDDKTNVNTQNKNDTMVSPKVINTDKISDDNAKQQSISDSEKVKQDYYECRKALILFIDKIYFIDSLVSIDGKQMTKYLTYYQHGRTDIYTCYKAIKIAKNSYEQAMMSISDITVYNNFPDSVKEIVSKIKDGLSNCYSSKEVASDKFLEILNANENSRNLEKFDDLEQETKIAEYNQISSMLLIIVLENHYGLFDYFKKRYPSKNRDRN